ncbi:tetratricopeptide repeat protein [Marinobacter adhaerens]|uniref:Tetratricopeptide repeat protein n=1 Tax=Marinobacter adhaerens TaxID=1033846 RepID=A0A851HSI8_9GAMM|nr:tetratricopeptide repeat protein [Marinobacter adhaerens]NWN90436.1 tetratricopeptide repeat protein [Marinobacter adhaerens]
MATRKTTHKSLPGLVLTYSLLATLPLLGGCNNNTNSSEAMSHLTRADTYKDQGQYRSAVLEVKNAIQKDPDEVENTVRLANLYLQVGAAKQATEVLEPWLSEQPDAVALLLARAYVEQRKHLSATETLALHTPASPEEQLEASLIRAEILRTSGELAEAQALYDNLVTSHSSSTEAITGLLKTQTNMRKPEQVIETADRWLASNEQTAEVLYWKGLAQYRQNQLEASSDTLTDAVGILPTSDIFLPIRRSVLSALSRVLTEQGKITEAQIYNRVLAENTDTNAREQAEAAIAALKDGNFDEAKSILRDTLKTDPENEQAAMLLGAISAGTGQLEEGTQLLTENLDPETTSTQFIRAATMAQIDAGEREAALETLERAVKARPNDNELLAMHGILALSLPEHQASGVASLSKAISNEPDRVRFRLALARHYIRTDKPEQALGQLRMAFTSNPADWETTSAYLSVLIQQDEKQEAIEIRDSLLNGYGDHPRAVLLASLTDVRLGNQDEATKRLETLVEEGPQWQAPKIALASLYAQSGKREKAIDLLVDAATLTPGSIRPLQQAGRIYVQDHSVAEAKLWLDDIAKNHPELKQDTDTLKAVIAINQGDLSEARTTLSKWTDSESATAKRAYGQLLLAETQAAITNKQWAEARAKAAEAIALEPESLRLALLPVEIARMEGETEAALSALDAVEETHGEVAVTMLTRAKLLNEQKGATPAYEYLSERWDATQNPALMPALNRLAAIEDPEAQDHLTQRWLDAAPQSPAAHMARAGWLMSNNQEPAAVPLYEQILTQQPHNIAALNNLAWVLRKDDPERALQLARQANQIAPDSSAVLDTYGWILHLNGNHAEAKAMIEKALALSPENRDIEAHLETVKKRL